MSFFLLGLSFPFSLYRSMNVRILQKWKSSPKVYPFSLSDYNNFHLLFWLWLYYHLVLSNPDNNQWLFVWCNVIVVAMFCVPCQRDFQVTITLGMTDYYMHMDSFGSSSTTLWGELWGEFNLYSMHLSLCSLKKLLSWPSSFYNANSYLPYVGWVTIIMTEKPFIKVCSFLYWFIFDWPSLWHNNKADR